jgi:DNA-binding Lrp family transcriptional regulator
MDIIDKEITMEMRKNCRLSYGNIGRKVGITRQAVAKRVQRLVRSGVITEFTLNLTPSLLGLHEFLGVLFLHDQRNRESLISTLGSNPFVHEILELIDDRCIILGIYRTVDDLSSLRRSTNEFEEVASAEFQPLMTQSSSNLHFSKTERTVLKHILHEPRLSVKDIAGKTGRTCSTIRKTLHKLVENRKVAFTISWNLSAGGNIIFMEEIQWTDGLLTHNDVSGMLLSACPTMYWQLYPFALQTEGFALFVVDRIEQVSQVFAKAKTIPGIIAENRPFVCQVWHSFSDLRLSELEKLIQ